MTGVVSRFELGGWDVTERLVEPPVVEPGDSFDDCELELAAGLPDAVFDQLGLKRVHERFGHGVVIGIANGGDRTEHPVIGQDLGVVVAGVLRPGS